MLNIYKDEWQLFFKKWLLTLLFATVCAVGFGFLLVKIVLLIDAESTYIYAGTFFMLYVAILFAMFLMMNLTNTRFNLLISFGKKRSEAIKYTIITSICYGAIVWGMAVLVNLLEQWFYPIAFANNVLETDFIDFSFFSKYGLVISVFLMCLLWFVCALMKKFGSHILAWIYLAMGFGILVCSEIDLGTYLTENSIVSAVAGVFAEFTPVAWMGLALILSAIFIVTGYNILKKLDVKF